MTDDISGLIINSRLFKGFSAQEVHSSIERIKPILKNYKKKEIVIRQDDTVDFIGMLATGLLSSAKIDREGNSSLIYMIEPSKIFGLDIAATPSQKSPVTVTCEVDAAAVLLPYTQLISDELVPAKLKIRLMRNIAEFLSNENMRRMYKIELLCQKSLRGRIWSYLDFIAQKSGSVEFEIPFNREQLAQYLNVNRSALSSELSKMRKQGFILFHKNNFKIL